MFKYRLMSEVIEAVYENGVIKPLEKVDLKDGERITIIIENVKEKRKKFLREFKPINLGRKITIREIEELRNENLLRY